MLHHRKNPLAELWITTPDEIIVYCASKNMAINTDVLTSLIGKLKILTLIIGVIDLGLAASSFRSVLSNEEFFLAIVIICFIISFLWMLLYIVGIVEESSLLTKIDFVYHAIGGLLLLISMICWFVSASDHKYPGSKYATQVFAGIFGLGNGVLYLVIGYLLLRVSGIVG